jgi:hypothetical protein
VGGVGSRGAQESLGKKEVQEKDVHDKIRRRVKKFDKRNT